MSLWHRGRSTHPEESFLQVWIAEWTHVAGLNEIEEDICNICTCTNCIHMQSTCIHKFFWGFNKFEFTCFSDLWCFGWGALVAFYCICDSSPASWAASAAELVRAMPSKWVWIPLRQFFSLKNNCLGRVVLCRVTFSSFSWMIYTYS